MSTPARPRPDGGAERMTADTAPTKLLLTVEEAAQHLGVGRTLMYQLISNGTVESVRIGRLRRVRPTDLARYAAALSAAGSAA